MDTSTGIPEPTPVPGRFSPHSASPWHHLFITHMKDLVYRSLRNKKLEDMPKPLSARRHIPRCELAEPQFVERNHLKGNTDE